MYKETERQINKGLSFGARLLLGSISTLFGFVMLLIALSTQQSIFFYLFGGFCILIAVACFTTGRFRQFIGSIIGSTIFCLGVWYLFTEVSTGIFFSSGRSELSILNACLFLFFIGIPSAVYVYRVRFGLRGKF